MWAHRPNKWYQSVRLLERVVAERRSEQFSCVWSGFDAAVDLPKTSSKAAEEALDLVEDAMDTQRHEGDVVLRKECKKVA